MGKPALSLASAALLLATPTLGHTQAAPPAQPPAPVANTVGSAAPAAEAANRIAGFTAWDDDFLYLAVQVNKPAIKATNNQPFSNPLDDDAVLITLQPDNDRTGTTLTARSVIVAVSAAGGAQLYTGPAKTRLFNGLEDFTRQLEALSKDKTLAPQQQDQARAALFSHVLKFQVTNKGATRASGTSVPGYTVEVAIPWTDLGGKPASGTTLGVNVVAQSTGDGSPALQSLSARVKTQPDVENPSLYSTLILSNAPAASTPDRLISPRVFASKPVIDGEISGGEWNGLSEFAFGDRFEAAGGTLNHTLAARVHPEFTPHPSRPVVPITASGELAPRPAHTAQPLPKLTLARYEYRYQADTRKAVPVEGVARPNGVTALAQHPLEGLGPWFSYDRADWHRNQLREMRRAGIDVALPVYRADARSHAEYADKGLMVLVTALQSLQQSGQDYPQIGLFLDTDSLVTDGVKPDLKTAGGQAALYAAIRDFYRHIPGPFRCQVTLAGEGGGQAYPVFLSDAAAFADMDAGFVNALRQRFARDFEGADLLLLGDSGFASKAPLDGLFAETQEKGYQKIEGGWLKVASVGPGYDTLNTPAEALSSGQTKGFRPRRGGDAYREDWKQAARSDANWVLIDGWNDYTTGAEVAPTLEFGFQSADITREYTRLWAGLTRRSAKILSQDAPAVWPTGSTFALHLRAQNTGIEGWGGTAGGSAATAFAYRWRKGVAGIRQGSGTPFAEAVNAGQNVNGTLNVGTDGLTDGDYLLDVGVSETPNASAAPAFLGGAAGIASIPVHVGAVAGSPAWAASLTRSDLPATLETGGVYHVQATLRNDGATVWRKADNARVTLRLYTTRPGESSRAVLEETPVETADASAMLPADVAPGQEVSVKLDVPVLDVQGLPLPVWTSGEPWTYTARWEVAADGGGSKPAGVSIAPQPVAVVEADFGVRFVADATPDSLPIERRLPVSVNLQNNGPQTWKHDGVRIGCHWYYADGTEFLFEDETTAISQDVPPGGKTGDTLVWVTAPPFNGTYWLAWDVKVGDTWASTTSAARAFDQTVKSVAVTGQRLTWVDLSRYFNRDGISDDDDLTDGDFDGQGRTLPASLVPPYANNAPVPAGIWLPLDKAGPESARRISFRLGAKDSKQNNFVACMGQRIELEPKVVKGGNVRPGFHSLPDVCRYLHIVAASGSKPADVGLRLIFQEPTGQSEDLYSFGVSPWNSGPQRGEEVAYAAARYHDTKGIQTGTVALYHYAIRIKEPRKLIAIVLPNAPDVKIAAITLER